MNSSFLKTPVYIVDEEGVIMEQKIGSQGQTHMGKKKHINSSKASPKLRVSWGSPYLSALGISVSN